MNSSTSIKLKIDVFKSLLFLILLFNLFFPLNVLSEETSKLNKSLIFEVLPLTLEDIVKSSDRIFLGELIKVKEVTLENGNLNAYEFTFHIIQGVKGTKSGKEITFNQWEHTIKNFNYEIGKEYVLFLFPNSKLGVTSPVGFSQGAFLVEEKPLFLFIKKRLVKNEKSNKGLNINLRTKKEVVINRDNNLNEKFQKACNNGEAIDLRDFMKVVKLIEEQIKHEPY